MPPVLVPRLPGEDQGAADSGVFLQQGRQDIARQVPRQLRGGDIAAEGFPHSAPHHGEEPFPSQEPGPGNASAEDHPAGGEGADQVCDGEGGVPGCQDPCLVVSGKVFSGDSRSFPDGRPEHRPSQQSPWKGQIPGKASPGNFGILI